MTKILLVVSLALVGCNSSSSTPTMTDSVTAGPLPGAPGAPARGGIPDDTIKPKPVVLKGGGVDDSIKPIQKTGGSDDSIKPIQKGGGSDDSIKPVPKK